MVMHFLSEPWRQLPHDDSLLTALLHPAQDRGPKADVATVVVQLEPDLELIEADG